ncbi:amino acid aldolase [Trypanosoma cruzi]|nr:amino acid aldolase [Trypanosoma cruzi]
MYFFGRFSFLAIAVLSGAYSVYAITKYRAACCVSRARLVIPRAVSLFYASLRKNDSARDFHQHQHRDDDDHTAKDTAKPLAAQPGVARASSSAGNWSGATETSTPSVSCPVVFVDNTNFEANVRAVVSLLLKNNKQVRLSTKGVRCPELLERAAALMEKYAVPCPEYDIISPGRPFVSGLLTSTAAETLLWARRGTFSSLLLGQPILDALSADRYVEAMTLNFSSKVRCLVVVDAVEQLELLWNAAKAWISDRGYTRLGFDNAVESLQFELMVRIDFSGDSLKKCFWRSEEPQTLCSPRQVTQFCGKVGEFNAKLSKEKLPVGVQFVIRGLWTYENGQLSQMDIAPNVLPNAIGCTPARWFLRYPLLQWYKQYVSRNLQMRCMSILQRLGYKKQVSPEDLLTSGGSSVSLVYSAQDSTLAEVCMGAGLLCGHQLDCYVDSPFKPSLYFALSVTRVAPHRIVICSGFGHNLSGAIPVYPPQLQSINSHGADIDDDLEVGVMVLDGTPEERLISIGDPIVFRPEYSSVLAELVDSFLLITEEGEVSAVMHTYRGEGWNIWA